MADNNRVFLPRIPEGATDEALREHFGRFGDIADCYIPVNPMTGKPKGLAFITFSSVDHAAAAVAQGEQLINGETCEVLKAAPRPDKRGGGGPIRREPDVSDPYLAGFLHAQRMMLGAAPPLMMPSRDREGPPRPRIFVRDVPETFEEDVMKRYFDKFGEITDCYIPEYKGVSEGKKKKGIAYITYKTEQQLSACLAEGETHTVEGVELSVTRADARREKERPGVSGWGPTYEIPYRSPAPARRSDFGGGTYGMHVGGSGGSERGGSEGNRIFVGGLPGEVTSEQVSEHFRQYGGEIADIYFPKDARTGSKRGFCYITFEEKLAVHRAVANAPREINGFSIGEVKVAEARPSDFSHAAGGRGAPRGGSERGGRGGDMGGYSYGEGRCMRPSYDRSWHDDAMAWGGGMMGGGVMGGSGSIGGSGSGIMPNLPVLHYAHDAYNCRSGEQWSGGGGGYGMAAHGFGDSVPREPAEIMERMAPLLNLFATATASAAYAPSNGGTGSGTYGGGGPAAWSHAAAQPALGGLESQYGGHGSGMSRGLGSTDHDDRRYRPY